MKRKSLLLISILICLLIFTSCNPTEPTITQNQNSALPASPPSQITSEVSDDQDLPNTMPLQIVSDGGGCTVTLDADINFPQAADYPVFGLKPTAITQAEADSLLSYFFGSAKLYSQSTVQTKSELENYLAKLKEQKEQFTNEGTTAPGVDIEIERVEELLKTAPDEVEKNYITSEFQETDGGDTKSQTIQAYADADTGAQTYIKIENIFDIQNRCLIAQADIISDIGRNIQPDSSLTGQAQGSTMSPDQAKASAESVLNNLGIEDVTVTSVLAGTGQNGQTQGYLVKAQKAVNGIPVTASYIKPIGENQDEDEDVMRADEITIAIDENGVSRFSWRYKSEITDAVSDQSQLMPVDQLTNIFKKEMLERYSWIDDPKYADANLTINIDKINLEYKCIAAQNNNLVITPVWNFYGTSSYSDSNGTTDNYYGKPDVHTFLCINALDGNVIDENLYFNSVY
jgi:hypothetical protein